MRTRNMVMATVLVVAVVMVVGLVFAAVTRTVGVPAAEASPTHTSTEKPSSDEPSPPGVKPKGDYLDIGGAARFHRASLELWWSWHGTTSTGRDFTYDWRWDWSTVTVKIHNDGPGRVSCEIRMGGERVTHDEGRRRAVCSADTRVKPMMWPIVHHGGS